MDADEVDETVGDQPKPFVGIVEQLSHRDGAGRQLSQMAEVADIFRSERVLDEEGTVRLEVLHEPHGQDGRHALVHVV